MGATLPTNNLSAEETSTHGLVIPLNSDTDISDVTVTPPQVRRTYQYPPPPGKKYFADNFKLGTRKFANHNVQDFLFGDSSDLNFLPSETGPIPFKRAADNIPIPAIRSVFNLYTDSLRLVNLTEEGLDESEYSLEFEFDSEVDCQISVLFSIPVEHSPSFLSRNISKDSDMCSRVFSYPAGYKQKFSEQTFQFCFGTMSNDVTYSPSSLTYPIVIKLQADVPIPCSTRIQSQIHSTLVSVETGMNRYNLVLMKQRLTVDTLTFLLQEIYGLNKPRDGEGDTVSLNSQNTSSSIQLEPGEECIVCLADAKDTLILPCRHLTTCAHCASSLKFQSKKCPICRREFTALLRIRPLTKSLHGAVSPQDSPAPQPGTFASEGYHHVSLFQAVHGITRSDTRPLEVPKHLLGAVSTPSPPNVNRTSQLIGEETVLPVAPYPATTYSKVSFEEAISLPEDV
ncbi:E3 ubiquitin-protein ligase MGRN1-like [Oopsacas minuta]|uniref:E3 ubiquitin-protein ligase MGRN1-like n=1 Tax=Oopsacas minuta TaxID=111878 RepID=A0AAV7JYA9_9METZ|nr:E3 ubiquitin-protein ligase MGRN1-like [Oopsacas minuta]